MEMFSFRLIAHLKDGAGGTRKVANSVNMHMGRASNLPLGRLLANRLVGGSF